MPVIYACTRVVYFLYLCHACDVVYYYFSICVCLTLTLMQVLYLPSGWVQPPGSPLSLQASPLNSSLVIITFYLCARVVLTSRAGTYSASGPTHFPSYPIRIGLVPFGFRGSRECALTVRSLMLCLISEFNTQRFPANSARA